MADHLARTYHPVNKYTSWKRTVTYVRGKDECQCGNELHKIVLSCIAYRSLARGHIELAIDHAQVRINRARADAQLLSDLGIGQSVCHQAQHLQFAASESM